MRAQILTVDLTRDRAGRRHDQAAPSQTSSASMCPKIPGSTSAMTIPASTTAAIITHLGTFRNQAVPVATVGPTLGAALSHAPTGTGSGTHSCQPTGGGPHAGSGLHPGGAVHPGGGAGQLGGGLKRIAVPGADEKLIRPPQGNS